MRILHLHPQRLAHVTENFYHEIWQAKFLRLDNLCHKCTLKIQQAQNGIWQSYGMYLHNTSRLTKLKIHPNNLLKLAARY